MRILSFITFLLGAAVSASAQPAPESDPARMILGAWVNKKDSRNTMVFSSNGKLLEYYDSELLFESSWEFVEECAGERTADGDYGMLRLIDSDGLQECYVVQGLESILTLLRVPEGNLLLFKRVE